MVKKLFIGYSQNTLYANNRGEDFFQPQHFELSLQTSSLQKNNLKELLLELSKKYSKRKINIITNLDNNYFQTIQQITSNKKYFKNAKLGFQAKTFLEKSEKNWLLTIYSSLEAKKESKPPLVYQTITTSQPSFEEAKKAIKTFLSFEKKYHTLYLKDSIVEKYHQKLETIIQEQKSTCKIYSD
ncbi:MAG: hypothetical protein ACOCQQ_01230 [Candidatus Nanoarchaeia archaeon]